MSQTFSGGVPHVKKSRAKKNDRMSKRGCTVAIMLIERELFVLTQSARNPLIDWVNEEDMGDDDFPLLVSRLLKKLERAGQK